MSEENDKRFVVYSDEVLDKIIKAIEETPVIVISTREAGHFVGDQGVKPYLAQYYKDIKNGVRKREQIV